MAKRAITLVANRTALTSPILDGEVTPAGIELDARQAVSIDDTSRRMLELEFDFGEVSLGTFLRARDRGVPLVAVPIFTNSRQFLNANLQVAARLGIRDLSELKGRTMGAPQYWTASSLWQRKFLEDFYAVEAQDMAWVTFQPERIEGLEMPPGVRHRFEPSKSPEEAAQAGEIDAFTTMGGGRRAEEGGGPPPALIPFFTDRAAAQRDYYQRTGIYPVQYVHVTSRELAEREPGVIASVCEAFVRAKEIAGARGPLASPDLIELLGDPWPFGIASNRRTLEALVEAAHHQGATSRQFAVEELFAPQLPPEMW